MKLKQLQPECYFVVAMMSIVTVLTMFLGYGWLHYFLVYTPLMLVGFSICIRFIFQTVEVKKWTRTLVMLVIVFAFPFAWSAARHIGKNLLFDFKGYYDNDIASVNEIMEHIPENERDSIWSYDVTPKYYLYADVLPAYKYFTLQTFQSAGNDYIQPGIEDMLENNPPEWVIMNTYPCDNEFITTVLSDKYEHIASVEYGLMLDLYHLSDAENK